MGQACLDCSEPSNAGGRRRTGGVRGGRVGRKEKTEGQSGKQTGSKKRGPRKDNMRSVRKGKKIEERNRIDGWVMEDI